MSDSIDSGSCLYDCRVMHHRLAPRVHRFEYGIFMLWLDLDELPALDRRLRTFSHGRRNLYEFRDSDHLVVPDTQRGQIGESVSTGSLREHLTAWLASQGVVLPGDSRIRLLTLPRVAGYIFSPVSFYFLHSKAGDPMGAVAEVQNTFGELKPYFVPVSPDGNFRVVVPKHFYVSPFSGLEVCFDFRLKTPGERFSLTVNDVSDNQTLLVSTLTGVRRPLDDRNLLSLTVKYPLVTLRVITLIHWHALKLWWKRLPWHAKASHPDLQRDVFRPHSSSKTPAPAPVSL